MVRIPEVSVIIVSFNTKNLLNKCLNSVYKSDGVSFEVIIVDNDSTDGTRNMIEVNYPQVKLIKNDQNVGFGKANNQGVAASIGTYIMFLNSDTQVSHDTIARLKIHAKEKKRAWIAPKLYNIDGTPQTSCGPFFSLPVVLLVLFFQGDKLGLTRWSPDTPTIVDWASGACLLTNREVIEDGLLFDESIFMYMDEVDLLLRSQKKGYETWVFPDALVIHMGTGSATEGNKQPVLNIYRGLIRMYQKHYKPWQLLLLKLLLKKKALLAWSIGTILKRSEVAQTYAEAYRLV